jgi:hypothetical protein
MDSYSPSCQVRLQLGRGRHLRFGLRAPSIIQAAYRSGLYASGPGPTSPVKSTAMVANWVWERDRQCQAMKFDLLQESKRSPAQPSFLTLGTVWITPMR